MSLWLTRILLPKCFLESQIDGRGTVYSLFKDDYAAHKTSWELFPNCPNAKRNFLTRLLLESDDISFFVLSEIPPHRPVWCPEIFFGTKRVSASFLDHSTYRFDLFANPTKMTHPERKDTLGKNGKRLALLKEEEQRAWFDRKAVANGFIVDFDSLRVAKPINRYFYKNGIRGNHIGVRFTGVLSVTDKDLFAKAFSHGIGTAKGFGFGMLMIQPIH